MGAVGCSGGVDMVARGGIGAAVPSVTATRRNFNGVVLDARNGE